MNIKRILILALAITAVQTTTAAPVTIVPGSLVGYTFFPKPLGP